MSVFPSQYSSLLHIIAAKMSHKRYQSVLTSQIRTLLDDEENFVDENFAEDESARQF